MAGECLDPTLLVQSSSRGSVHELILSAYIVLCGRAVLPRLDWMWYLQVVHNIVVNTDPIRLVLVTLAKK